jgi:hypothetical protein
MKSLSTALSPARKNPTISTLRVLVDPKIVPTKW